MSSSWSSASTSSSMMTGSPPTYCRNYSSFTFSMVSLLAGCSSLMSTSPSGRVQKGSSPRCQSIRISLDVASRSGSPPFLSLPFLMATFLMKSQVSSHWSILQKVLRNSIFLTFSSTSLMQKVGWSIFSARTHPFSTLSTSSLPSLTCTVPGQSIRQILLVRVMYCQTLVSPGTGAALQTFLSLRVLMTLDLPTLGYPTKPMLMFFLSRWKMSNWRNRLMRDPLPKGRVMEDLNAMVGYILEQCLTHLASTHIGTKSALFISSTMCLWGQFFLMCSSRALDRVPSGSLESSTCTTTSEQSSTLCSSSQILLDCPADILLSLFSSRSPSFSTLRLWSFVMSYYLCSTYSTIYSKVALLSLTFLRRLAGPKVSLQVQTSSSLILFSLMGSLRREVGSFLVLTKILVGSWSFLATSILSFSISFWSMVLTLPNHIRLGSILAASVGRSCIFSRSGIFCLYIFSLLMVALDRRELFLPSVLPLITRSGFSDELECPPFPNLRLLILFDLCSPFYFFPIVDLIIYYSSIGLSSPQIRTNISRVKSYAYKIFVHKFKNYADYSLPLLLSLPNKTFNFMSHGLPCIFQTANVIKLRQIEVNSKKHNLFSKSCFVEIMAFVFDQIYVQTRHQ